MLAEGDALPAATLARHVQQAQASMAVRAKLFVEADAVVHNYKGSSFRHMGHSAQFTDEIQFFDKVLAERDDINTICEIGFNAGHSAIVWLHGSAAVLKEFDVGPMKGVPWHNGSRAFIEAIYPSRVQFFIGDSRETVAHYAKRVAAGLEPPCDLWYVDGLHSDNGPSADLHNALRASSPRAYVIADDCTRRFIAVKTAFNQHKDAGTIYNVTHGYRKLPYIGDKAWCAGWFNTSVPSSHWPKIARPMHGPMGHGR